MSLQTYNGKLYLAFGLPCADCSDCEHDSSNRVVLNDVAGVELPPPARKTTDLEGRIAKDGVRKALKDRQIALTGLVDAVREYRRLAETTPLTLQGAGYAHAVQELNKAIDRAESLCSNEHPGDGMQACKAPVRPNADELLRR